MENKPIPTAEKIFKKSFEGYHPSQYNELHDVQKDRSINAMIEFAKLHCQKQVKVILNNVKLPDDKWDSIINAYDLNNIK